MITQKKKLNRQASFSFFDTLQESFLFIYNVKERTGSTVQISTLYAQ